MNRYSFSGVGYHYGYYGIFDSLVGKFVLVFLVALIVFGLVMLIKVIRNKK
jgi:uncharacterized membrane protein